MTPWARAADIGGRLRTVRTRLGMTQEAFGELMGVTDQTVSDYEGGRSQPTRSRLERLARLLGISAMAFARDFQLPTEIPQLGPGWPQEGRTWEEPSPTVAEIRDRQRALQAMIADFHRQTAALRASGLMPTADKLLEWWQALEEAAANPPAPDATPTPLAGDPGP